MNCGVGHRCGSDLALLWHRPAVTALIQPLAWELPHAEGMALKRQQQKQQKTGRGELLGVMEMVKNWIVVKVAQLYNFTKN